MRRYAIRTCFAWLPAAIALAGCAPAPDPPRVEPVADAALSDPELAALLLVAKRASVDRAQLAWERSSHPAVRELAAHMYGEHEAAYRDVLRFTEAAGIRPEPGPAARDAERRAAELMDALTARRGMSFDRAYLTIETESHGWLIRVSEQAARAARERDTRAWLARLTERLNAHVETLVGLGSGLVGYHN